MAMVHFQIHSWLIFFMIIAITLAEGRQLKSSTKQEDLHYNKDRKHTQTQAIHTLNAVQKHLKAANSFHVPPAGGVRPLVARTSARFPPQVPTQIQGDGISELKAVTTFRPTARGNSPGAGHSFTKNGLGSSSKAVENVHGIPYQSTAESDTGFRPTKPGNSPGAGHSTHNQIAKPKA